MTFSIRDWGAVYGGQKYPSKMPSEVTLADPLTDVTRKERRALLGVALLSFVIARTGLSPTEITSLGIKFAAADQRALLAVLAAVTGYFLVAFVVYAASDFLAWRYAFNRAVHDLMEQRVLRRTA
jgi:hypothetical protein